MNQNKEIAPDIYADEDVDGTENDIKDYLDGVWEHLALWKKKDILEQAGFNLAISAKQEEYLDELHSEAIKSEDFEV